MNWQEIIVFGIVLLAGVAMIRTFLQQFSAASPAGETTPACTKCPGCALGHAGRSSWSLSAPRPMRLMLQRPELEPTRKPPLGSSQNLATAATQSGQPKPETTRLP
ncbi:MAG: hypothetical protein ONB48_10295 [candidate division KSB1 bacterium]|nr:hypothetical protein [candidate division KSB1 bacterium]MDZ7273878.1 hypothetical protein [candidate division KSB1 bacterium]MDZ7286034.1 hypothetical protein [candidate division KSB1 bacterium]MDZ7299066.1 hypothetical protein [candidate division KSB1 bacterium]MDZ7308203.1 hypothetical protein [candidate division KSB1 bacterium]